MAPGRETLGHARFQAAGRVSLRCDDTSTPAACSTSQPAGLLEWQQGGRGRRWLVRKESGRSIGGPRANPVAFGSLTMTQAPLPGSKHGPHEGSEGSKSGSSRKQPPHDLVFLPAGTHRGRGPGKSVLRYAWDGTKVVAVDEAAVSQTSTAKGRFQQWLSNTTDSLYRAFFPDTKDVTSDYWEWLRWRLTQRFFSSTMQNLSTQSLLLALGMGAKKTIAASAAINWLLKDGVGRIARMTVATNFGQSFDSDLKRIRYVTSCVFEATIGCEFITPFFPQHFLVLASIANLGKAIALAAFVATAPAFQQALCRGGNLADITAKNQAQHMVVDMLSLGVSASAMYAAKNMKVPALLPLAAYPLLAASDLYAIYRELKAVELRTLNRERADMVIEGWLTTGKVPCAAEISARERLLLPPDEDCHSLAAAIVPLRDMLQSPSQLSRMQQQYKDSQYMLTVQQPRGGGGLFASLPLPGIFGEGLAPKPRIAIALSEEAKGSEVLTALLEAAYLRKAVHDKVMSSSSGSSSSSSTSGGSSSGKGAAAAAAQQEPGAHRYFGRTLSDSEVEGMRRDAHKRARRDAKRLLQDMQGAGWKVNPFLLSTAEKEGYVLLDD